jgi:hypothetical protein
MAGVHASCWLISNPLSSTHLSRCGQDTPSRLEVLPGSCYDVKGTLSNAAAVKHLQQQVWVRSRRFKCALYIQTLE